MNDKLFCTGAPVTLVGGGAIDPGDLDLALSRAPALVAADSGAAPVLAAGHVPDAVFGDFDSISTPKVSPHSPKTMGTEASPSPRGFY